MKPAELEQARLGFNQYLRRKGFSPQFIARNADDLLATATLEYSRKIAEGDEIDNPAGWLITCASQRTKNLLEVESRTPRQVSAERTATLVDEGDQSPEDVVLEEDRFRKVREATEQLSEDERRLLALSYFEDLAVREAARMLRWHPSKAQRCHRSARKHLHELLGVESLDELEVEIGLAAYISVAATHSSGLQLRAGMEALVDATGRGAADLWARAQELARRLPAGGSAEPSATAALGGSVGRAAGACVGAAAACLAATGVVGPGVGGVDVIGGAKQDSPRQARKPPPPPARLAPSPAPTPSSRERPPASSASGKAARPEEDGSPAATAAERTRRANRAVRSQSIESAATEPTSSTGTAAASAPASSEAPAPETSAPSSSGSTSTASQSSPTQAAEEQFGLP